MDKKHSYYHMLAILKQQRNRMIAEFQFFKRNPVNRKWIAPSHFSATVQMFRHRIWELDHTIQGAKRAIAISRETGVVHYFDYHTNEVLPAQK